MPLCLSVDLISFILLISNLLNGLSLKCKIGGCGHGFSGCDGLGGPSGFDGLGGFGGFSGLGGFGGFSGFSRFDGYSMLSLKSFPVAFTLLLNKR